jgi:hypothetical protein
LVRKTIHTCLSVYRTICTQAYMSVCL